MAIFKCKMCGGSLEITEGMEVCECEFCGTKQTLPKLNDEKQVGLYDRANHFRRNNDFDKAMAIYEQILNSDNTDAEAYWSIVLCRYGIQYVEDPTSHEQIPTVNRAQYKSIFVDEDYKEAIHYASESQKVIFEKEAKTIDEIQKGILAISQKEEPFDIFICYKETDENGNRTQDSVIANDLYHQLTREGFKVFFAAITLEDKLGRAYEPYIFAALNSAKAMIVLGTKPEYFQAPWVKNEWSRYLMIIKDDPSKILIPAYRGMDPYDLPDEFSFLQAQDMGKIGFMNDIIHGLKKVADKGAAAKTEKQDTLEGMNSGSGIDALIKRAFFFIEDSNWANAGVYCEKVLDQNPECAEAYVAKLMVELKVSKEEDLGNGRELLFLMNNYKNAYKFADDTLKARLKGYEDKVTAAYYQAWYDRVQQATDENTMREIIDKLEQIRDYSNTAEVITYCEQQADLFHKERLYGEAIYAMEKAVSDIDYARIIKLFEELDGYKESEQMIAECNHQIKLCHQNDKSCTICRKVDGIKAFIPNNSSAKCCDNCFSRLMVIQQNYGKVDALTKNSVRYIKDCLLVMNRQDAINRVQSILTKYQESISEVQNSEILTEEEKNKRELLKKVEQEKAQKENEERLLREQKQLRDNTIRDNANYEYDIQIVVDNPSGGMDVDMLKYMVQKHSSEGWKLHTVITSSTGGSFGQTVVIFERRIKPEK